MNWNELNFKQNDRDEPVYQECQAQITQIVGDKFKGKFGFFQDIMVLCPDGQANKQKFYYQGLDESTIKFLGPDEVQPGKIVNLECKITSSDNYCNYQGKKYTFRFPGSGKSTGGGTSGGGGGRSSYRGDTPEQVFGKILTQLTGHALSKLKPTELFPNQSELDNLKLLSTWIMMASKEYGDRTGETKNDN